MLVAAAEDHIAEELRDHVSQGMDTSTAGRLAATSFSAATMFTPEACAWVVSEFSIALGLITGAEGPATVVVATAPQPAPATAPLAPAPEPAPATAALAPARGGSPTIPPRLRQNPWRGQAARLKRHLGAGLAGPRPARPAPG